MKKWNDCLSLRWLVPTSKAICPKLNQNVFAALTDA